MKQSWQLASFLENLNHQGYPFGHLFRKIFDCGTLRCPWTFLFLFWWWGRRLMDFLLQTLHLLMVLLKIVDYLKVTFSDWKVKLLLIYQLATFLINRFKDFLLLLLYFRIQINWFFVRSGQRRYLILLQINQGHFFSHRVDVE